MHIFTNLVAVCAISQAHPLILTPVLVFVATFSDSQHTSSEETEQALKKMPRMQFKLRNQIFTRRYLKLFPTLKRPQYKTMHGRFPFSPVYQSAAKKRCTVGSIT